MLQDIYQNNSSLCESCWLSDTLDQCYKSINVNKTIHICCGLATRLNKLFHILNQTNLGCRSAMSDSQRAVRLMNELNYDVIKVGSPPPPFHFPGDVGRSALWSEILCDMSRTHEERGGS